MELELLHDNAQREKSSYAKNYTLGEGELYTMVLVHHNSHTYSVNGVGVGLAKKGQFDVSRDSQPSSRSCEGKHSHPDAEVLALHLLSHLPLEAQISHHNQFLGVKRLELSHRLCSSNPSLFMPPAHLQLVL